MKRKELISIMQTVEPAIASTTFVPVLSHFWFTGKRVMAFNDHIAISMRCETEFVGAVPRTLLALLTTTPAEEIEMQVKERTLQIKAASSRFKLAIMGKEDFLFKMPKMKSNEPIGVDASRFVQAMETCMYSVGTDTSRADHLGVTMIEEAGKLLLFATDQETISHAAVPLKGSLGIKRVILPADFCRQFLVLAKGAASIKLELAEDYVLFRDGPVMLYGRLVEPDNPLNFKGVLQQEISFADKDMFDIPEKLQNVLARACIVSEGAIDKSRSEIRIDGNKVHFFTKSERGEVSDTILAEKALPAVHVRADPKRMADGYGRFNRMYVTDSAVVMKRDDMIYMIAATQA